MAIPVAVRFELANKSFVYNTGVIHSYNKSRTGTADSDFGRRPNKMNSTN